jgi:hypothetical protein
MPPSKRFVVLAGTALALASAVVVVIVLGRIWDNPHTSNKKQYLNSAYDGGTFRTTLECDCPDYLIQQKPQQLSFLVSTERMQSARSDTRAQASRGAVDPVMALPSASSITPIGTRLNLSYKVDGHWGEFDGGGNARVLANNSAILTRQSYKIMLTPKDGEVLVTFVTGIDDANTSKWLNEYVAANDLVFATRPAFLPVLLPYLGYGTVFVVVASLVFFVDHRMRTAKARQEAKLAHARELVDQNPERARFAWQLARTRLESYFDRNLFQVNLVFWVAVLVMTAGFVVVLWGINRAEATGTAITPGAGIAVAAGVLTQFLGATFMVLYRSTMRQANDFILVLDRINNVGMAMQVLDQIPDNPPELKNDSRAKIIEHLLTLGPAIAADDPGAAK